MKYYWLILISVALGLACRAADQATNTNTSAPLASGIILHSKGNYWTVEQLYKSGLEFLKTNGVAVSERRLESIVHILADDKVTMCEIQYLEGFGRPVWTVKFNYDGRATSYQKRTMRG